MGYPRCTVLAGIDVNRFDSIDQIEKMFDPENNTSVELGREDDSALEPVEVKSSTPVKQDPLFGLCGSPVRFDTRLDCPLFKFGNDYAPPELLIPSRFPNISPRWFANHQPLGTRDELFVSTVRRRINPNEVLQTIRGQSPNNAPYIMSYIRIFQTPSGSHSHRDRQKLDYYSLVHSNGGSTTKTADQTLQVDDSKILKYQLAHPIFIPRCLAWIDADAFSSSTTKCQILGKSLTFSLR